MGGAARAIAAMLASVDEAWCEPIFFCFLFFFFCLVFVFL